MDPEAAVCIAALALAWPACWAVAALPFVRPSSARSLERVLWWRLCSPLVAPTLVIACVAGWVFVEPIDTRTAPRLVLAFAAPVAVVWARALARAVWALAKGPAGPAFTAGLFRPTISITPEFATKLDRAAAAAVLEHERAHVRHLDPLRIWLGQLAADLQWPLPSARIQLTQWRRALELARDEEARRRGVDGADLAQAILVAAGLQADIAGGATLLDGNAALELRIRRLLEPLPTVQERSLSERWGLRFLGLAVVGAAVTGAVLGRPFVVSVFGAL